MANETWNSVAVPIMEAIAERDRAGDRASFRELIEVTGLEEKAVERELRALIHSKYVGGIDVTNLGGFDYESLHLHEKGKVAIGEWPADDAYRVLLEILDRRITDEKDPDERSRFGRLRDALTDVGTGAGGNILAELLRSLG